MKNNKDLAIRLMAFCTVMLVALQTNPMTNIIIDSYRGGTHSIGLFGVYDEVKKVTRVILTLLPMAALTVISFMYGLLFYFILSYAIFYTANKILKKYNLAILHFNKAYLCTSFSIVSYSFILYSAFIGNYIFGIASVLILTLFTVNKTGKKSVACN